MQMKNNVTEFILLGLTQDPVRKKIVFVIFLVFYLWNMIFISLENYAVNLLKYVSFSGGSSLSLFSLSKHS